QGICAAAIQAVSLSLILEEFEAKAERARALTIFASVMACGGSAGVLSGGLLTSVLNWRWIFVVNLPIGALVCGVCIALQFHPDRGKVRRRLDVAGALTVTAALTLASGAIFNAANTLWASFYVLAPLCGAVVLFLGFLTIESRARAPLVPLSLFKHHSL